MTITAYSGPIGQFGTVLTSSAGTGIVGGDIEHNEQRAPMFSDLGDSMMDPRVAYSYQPGQGASRLFMNFYNNVATVDYVPLTASASWFVTSSYVSSGITTYSIPGPNGVSSNGVITTTIIAPETGKVTGTLLAIDSTAAYLTFGSAASQCLWNPAAGTGRCVQIITSSSGDAGVFTIAGRDMYGYKMTETLALSQGTSNSSGITITGQKAFKYISAITNTTTPTSTGVSIGFSDHFGMPLYTPYTGLNCQVAVIASNVGSTGTSIVVPLSTASFVVAFPSTATPTSTAVDVRGVFTSTTASNGVVRLQVVVTPTAGAAAAITSTNVAPFFGATQFSSV
jgi:hypothetical protein